MRHCRRVRREILCQLWRRAELKRGILKFAAGAFAALGWASVVLARTGGGSHSASSHSSSSGSGNSGGSFGGGGGGFGGLVVLLRMNPRYGTLAVAALGSRLVQSQFDLFWVSVQVSVPFVLVGICLGAESYFERNPDLLKPGRTIQREIVTASRT